MNLNLKIKSVLFIFLLISDTNQINTLSNIRDKSILSLLILINPNLIFYQKTEDLYITYLKFYTDLDNILKIMKIDFLEQKKNIEFNDIFYSLMLKIKNYSPDSNFRFKSTTLTIFPGLDRFFSKYSEMILNMTIGCFNAISILGDNIFKFNILESILYTFVVAISVTDVIVENLENNKNEAEKLKKIDEILKIFSYANSNNLEITKNHVLSALKALSQLIYQTQLPES